MTQSKNDLQNKAFTNAGLNLIAQALSIFDADLKLRVSNLPYKRMFNLPDDLVQPGARFDETIRHLVLAGEYGPVDDVDGFVAERVRQARTFEPHYMERTRANGRTISVEGSPLPQGGWVAVYTDITTTTRSEALLRERSDALSGQVLARSEELAATNRKLAATVTALEEAKRALTEAESRARLTAEMMPAHIAHVDEDGFYTYSNRRLSAILPGRPSDLHGLHISKALGDSAYDRIKPHLDAAYGGESPVFEFTEDHDARRIRVAFTPDGNGGVFILSMDVTQETQARAALQQTRRRELAAQITSGMAHDFSNLLTIILGLQGRLEKLDLPPEALDLAAATRKAARRGGRILNRLADMLGNRQLRPRPTDLHALLRDLKLLATPSLPREIGLSVVDTTPDGMMMLDPGLVQDALLNLILNARDACGTHGQITVSAHRIGDTWIEISVNDTGPGFSETALDKALVPFFTTKGAEGSGLGLPMVYDMTKLAGGDLQLGNTTTGARVVLRLPYRAAHAQPGGLALLVEDDPGLRAQVRDMLIGLGHPVVEAASADEAAALASALPDIALVLSDIGLEGEATGLDLLDRLSGYDLTAILMTALPPSDPLYQSATARVPVLQKPFDRADLAAMLSREAAA